MKRRGTKRHENVALFLTHKLLRQGKGNRCVNSNTASSIEWFLIDGLLQWPQRKWESHV